MYQLPKVPITSLTPHPRNVRQGDIGAICTSLQQFGQYRPIVFQTSTRRIIAGNHTWKAARQLGWTEIAATHYDCDDETALRILVADNRATDLATYDDSALQAMLEELARTEQGLTGTLFDEEDLQHLIEKNENLPNLSEIEDGTEKKIDPAPIICPNCGEHITYATP